MATDLEGQDLAKQLKRIDNSPLVSICCITFNHAPYIKDCLDGFLNQKTNFKYEILIHDDASSDGTERIIKEYETLFPEIVKPIYQIENQYSKGIAINKAFNYTRAKGKYIAICEGDDYWIDPLKLQKQVDFLEANPNCGLVATDFDIWHQYNRKIEKSIFVNQPTDFPIYKNFEDFLLGAGFMAPCTWVFRTELAPRSKKLRTDGSFALLLDIYAKSEVHVLPDTTTVYRKLKESASHSKSIIKMYKRSLGILKMQLEYVEEYELSDNFRFKVLKKHYSQVLTSLVVMGDKEEIAKARECIPKKERSIKQNFLFHSSRIPIFGSKIIGLILWFKDLIIHK